MRVLSRALFLILLSVIFYFSGSAVTYRYALEREISRSELILAENLESLSYCKEYGCERVIEEALIAQNDSSLRSARQAEIELDSGFFALVSGVAWPLIHYLYVGSDSRARLLRVRSYYDELGCGVGARACSETNETH